MNPVDHIPI